LNKKGWEIPAFSNSEYSTSSGKEIKRMSVDHLRVINIKQRQLVSEIRVLEQAIDEIRKKMNCSHP
jgi:hypothetical protein